MPAVLNLLRIKNLALVEELEWQLEPGFTAITGETGAGKSIIIGALQLLLGERADKSLIRTGAEVCTVEAVFSGETLAQLNPRLQEAGVEECEGELILKRTLSSSGANRQFINGSPTTLAVLKSLGDELVDLHGPHDHQSLLSAERQLDLLDAFAHAGPALAEYQQHFRTLQTLTAEHAALSTAETAREQELDLLRHQVAEIEAAQLDPSEEEQIETRFKLASNSKRLIELASGVAGRLAEADDAVLTQLADTQRLLRELEKLDPAMAEFAESHANAVVELSEVARSLAQYVERLDLDPQQLAALEERVSLFETLKRKYGGSLTEAVRTGERAAERIRKIEGRDAELERLAQAIANAEGKVMKAAEALHKLRSKAAPKLSEMVRRNLRELGFRQSEFEAQLTSPGRAPRARDRCARTAFLAQPRRAAEASPQHRLQRRNLAPDARDQIRSRRPGCHPAPRLR